MSRTSWTKWNGVNIYFGRREEGGSISSIGASTGATVCLSVSLPIVYVEDIHTNDNGSERHGNGACILTRTWFSVDFLGQFKVVGGLGKIDHAT